MVKEPESYASSAYTVASASHYLLGLAFGGQPGHVLGSSNSFIRCTCADSPKAEQSLERSHRCPATVVTENELIQVCYLSGDESFPGSLQTDLRKGAKSAVPLADRAIGNLQQWLLGTYHGVSRHQLQVSWATNNVDSA